MGKNAKKKLKKRKVTTCCSLCQPSFVPHLSRFIQYGTFSYFNKTWKGWVLGSGLTGRSHSVLSPRRQELTSCFQSSAPILVILHQFSLYLGFLFYFIFLFKAIINNWQKTNAGWQWQTAPAAILSSENRNATLEFSTNPYTLLNSLALVRPPFALRSLSSSSCNIRPHWSAIIDDKHWSGRVLIPLLVIRMSWINDRGYRAQDRKTKPQ